MKIKLSSLPYVAAKQILFALLPFYLSSCQDFVFEKELNKLLGVTNAVVKQRTIFEEVGGVHGEGYAIEVYKLSEGTIENFNKNTDKTLRIKDNSTAWKKYGFKQTPIDTSFNEVTSMIIDYSAGEGKLKEGIDTIKKAMKTKGNYYSFYYKPDKDNPYHVLFFLLDMNKNTLYVVDQHI